MFKNLSTSTKLFILCGMFIAALSVTTYSLVMEKRIARVAYSRPGSAHAWARSP